MQVGEDALFSEIKNIDNNTIITARGRSCGYQIKDGTQQNPSILSLFKEKH